MSTIGSGGCILTDWTCLDNNLIGFDGCLLIGIVDTIDFGDCPLKLKIIHTTIDFGDSVHSYHNWNWPDDWFRRLSTTWNCLDIHDIWCVGFLLFPRFSSSGKVMSDQFWRLHAANWWSDGKRNSNNWFHRLYITLIGIAWAIGVECFVDELELPKQLMAETAN